MRRCMSSEALVLSLVFVIGFAATGVLAEADGGNAAAVKANRAAAREAKQAELAKAKEARQAELAKAKEARETKKEEIKEAREAKKEEIKEKATGNREDVVDNRENRQGKRIQHGINKGYLTADEVKKLQTQQDSIAALESSFKADGKVTGNEFHQLQKELNEASHCIWAEKHDTDGNQMPTYRLGKNVFAKGDLTSKLADENLSAADAKALLADFGKTIEAKRKLSTDDLSAEARAKLQAEYDAYLNKYFEVK